MRHFLIFIFFISFFTTCQNSKETTNCYQVNRDRNGTKTMIFIKVTNRDGQVNGEQQTIVTGPNGQITADASGTFSGRETDGVYWVDYEYFSNNETRIAEEEFKIEGDELFLTMSAYSYVDGKERIKERGLFNVTMPKIECP